MNRRDFLTFAGGITAVSMLTTRTAMFAAEKTTPFFVRGLAMVSASDPDYLRIALPRAPHHRATFAAVPAEGEPRTMEITGDATLEGIAADGGRKEIELPELIHVREIYRDATPRLESSPSVISIPWSAVASIATEVVSENRWTFVWKDSGDEVASFRPRRIAESLRIDLISSGTFRMNGGQVAVPLAGLKEITTDFIPTHDSMGDFSEHFAFYMPYVDTGADHREVVPKEVGVLARRQARTVTFGNAFAPAARVWPYYACFALQVD